MKVQDSSDQVAIYPASQNCRFFPLSMITIAMIFVHKGSDWAWALFWALKKALKRVKPLKKGLSRVNLLFWALRKVLKRADLLKIVLNWEVLLKRGLNWVGHSKKGSREERSNSKEGSVLNWVSHSKKFQIEESRKNKKPILWKDLSFDILSQTLAQILNIASEKQRSRPPS